MNSYNIFNYKEIVGILTFILVIVMITEKLSLSYAVPVNYNKFNSGHIQDNPRWNVDDNAFSNLSRNMTSTTNSMGPNLARDDRNTNSGDNIGVDGTGGNDISGSILTEHSSSNSNLYYHSSRSSSSPMFVQHGYQLIVNLPPIPLGTSTMSISIVTANGYTDQAIASAGVPSWSFNIPPEEGNWIRVCVNSGQNCNTYSTTGKDMSVSISSLPLLDNSNGNYMYPGNNGIDGFDGHQGNHGNGIR